MSAFTPSDKLVLGAGALAVLAVVWTLKKGTDLAAQALPYVNPADSNNVINQGAQKLFVAVTGNEVDSWGTGLYGWWYGRPDVGDVAVGNAEQRGDGSIYWVVLPTQAAVDAGLATSAGTMAGWKRGV